MASSPHDSLVADRYPMQPLLDFFAPEGRAERSPRRAIITGADGPFLANVIADIARRLDGPDLLVISPSSSHAASLHSDLTLFAQEDPSLSDEEDDLPSSRSHIALFPEYDVGPFHQASPDRKLTLQRLTTLQRLCCETPPKITVTSVRALARKTLPRQVMNRYTRTFKVGDEVDNTSLRELLSRCGYAEVKVVEDPGTFAIRGDIIDVFTPLETHPVRMERWGDEIAELRTFHPQTQRTILDDLDACTVFPIRQEILDKQAISIAHERLYELGESQQVPSSTIQTVLTDLRSNIHFIGIDAILPALHPHLETLLDYLPEERDTVLLIVKPETCLTSLEELLDKREREHGVTREQKALFFPTSSYYLSIEELIQAADRFPRLDLPRVAITPDPDRPHFSPPPGDLEAATFAFHARSNEDIVRLRKSCQGPEQMIKALSPMLSEWMQTYGRICIACRTKGQAERLEGLLKTFFSGDSMILPPPLDVSEPLPPPAHLIEIYHAPLSQGFRSEMLGLCLISGGEIFGQRVATEKKKGAAQSFSDQTAISHFRELTVGDLVVHVDFGIGRYLGLVHMDVEGVGNDFLQLQYANDDKLYLPIYRLGRVQRYIGSADTVRLDRLGGNGWEKTKERVKANIREIAGELLALYARREMAKGFAFSPPEDLYREFEDHFPFEETVDQGRAIEETLSDMQRVRPMDRLICGDVGFGKTEVAIRAAMKAALDNKQVAVLVPTTILAEQHQISFKKRMDEHGVVVECLSRFRSPKEAKSIIERTNEGKVDVLIGTHRLLNKQIEFRDLGLLIVDEEQRFGVAHKEKIKRLKNQIDVLTLSATPIPRTLQMSLLGIRDLSIIATPPHDRLAVRTHVAKFSDGIIREAIMRELERGGQVFFVHNRVATIEEMATHLRELVPEARVGIGHGQMGEQKLEEVMLKYVRGEINVLLCSTIIESGLDIPNANTILVNRADMFGLSQLYQLRGRVGRGKERAYAYLLIPARGKLAKDAERRLDVIQTHTELGSGFHVASYDLEIRGAGNLLSDDQSGHVTAVGLDLYNELLEEAVHDLRGEEVEDEIEPEVNIPVESFIPEDYIPATSLRLMFYKRFSLARTLDELDETFAELVDRFGQSPRSVQNLRQIVAIKIGLRQMRARRLDAGPSAIVIHLDQSTKLDPQAIMSLVQQSRGKLRVTQDMRIALSLKPDESAAPLKTSRKLIDMLVATM